MWIDSERRSLCSHILHSYQTLISVICHSLPLEYLLLTSRIISDVEYLQRGSLNALGFFFVKKLKAPPASAETTRQLTHRRAQITACEIVSQSDRECVCVFCQSEASSLHLLADWTRRNRQHPVAAQEEVSQEELN